jgi:hypothetical protein
MSWELRPKTPPLSDLYSEQKRENQSQFGDMYPVFPGPAGTFGSALGIKVADEINSRVVLLGSAKDFTTSQLLPLCEQMVTQIVPTALGTESTGVQLINFSQADGKSTVFVAVDGANILYEHLGWEGTLSVFGDRHVQNQEALQEAMRQLDRHFDIFGDKILAQGLTHASVVFQGPDMESPEMTFSHRSNRNDSPQGETISYRYQLNKKQQ